MLVEKRFIFAVVATVLPRAARNRCHGLFFGILILRECVWVGVCVPGGLRDEEVTVGKKM